MNLDLISIEDAAKAGIQYLRDPVWVHACDHLKIDILEDGTPGPWTHLYSPYNRALGNTEPVNLLCVQMDYRARTWAVHTGPVSGSPEYEQEEATSLKMFNGLPRS